MCLILKSSPPLQINQAYLTLKFIEAILLRAKQRRLPLKHLHIWDDRVFRNTKLYTFKLVPWSQIDSVAIKVTVIRSAATVRTRRRAVGWCRISTDLTETSTTNKAELPNGPATTTALWTATLSLHIIIYGLMRLWGLSAYERFTSLKSFLCKCLRSKSKRVITLCSFVIFTLFQIQTIRRHEFNKLHSLQAFCSCCLCFICTVVIGFVMFNLRVDFCESPEMITTQLTKTVFHCFFYVR